MGIRIRAYGVRRAELEQLLAMRVGDLRAQEPLGEALIEAGDDELVGDRLRVSAFEAAFLLDALFERPWPRTIQLVRGHRRWWVGSMAEALERQGFRDDPAMRTSFAALRALVAPFDTGCAWLDAITPHPRDLFPEDPEGDVGSVDLPVVSVLPVFEAAATIDRFGAPSGFAARWDEPGVWTQSVRRHVDTFRALRVWRAHDGIDHVVSAIV